MDFAFYNATSVRGFTSMLTVVCGKTRILFIFTTAYKLPPVRIIFFILTIFNNKNHPLKRIRVDEDGDLEKSTYVTNLIFD